MFFPSIFSNADSKRKKKNKLRLIELEVFVAVFFDQAFILPKTKTFQFSVSKFDPADKQELGLFSL